jgi:hypothetical protein
MAFADFRSRNVSKVDVEARKGVKLIIAKKPKK